MMKHLAETRKTGGVTVKEVLTKNKMLVERTIFDKELEAKKDQVDFLLLAQGDLAKRPEGDAVLLAVCNELYLLDVLDEDGFEQWWEDERGTASDELKAVRAQTEKLVKTLTEDSDGSSDDDNDDDEGESSEEGG